MPNIVITITKAFGYCWGKRIPKSSLSLIWRNKLNHKYLKTSCKNFSLLTVHNKLLCLALIKYVTRSLEEHFNIIFVDESKLELNNYHLKTWRKTEENIISLTKKD